MYKTMPSCLGLDPQTTNTCQECDFKDLCEYIRANFIAKDRLQPICEKLEKILTGVTA